MRLRIHPLVGSISEKQAKAKPMQQHIELEQMRVRGLLNISNTKEANKNRISEAVAQDHKMKIIDSKCAEVLGKLEDSGK